MWTPNQETINQLVTPHSNNNGRAPNLLVKVGTLSILYVSVFLTRIGFGIILIIFPIYLLGPNGTPIATTTPALSAIVLALYPALEGLTALPVGAWVDRKGRRRAFVVGMASISVLTLAISLTQTNIPFVAGAHALMGLSAAMVTISSLTMITDLTVIQNRGTGMGAFDMANLVGYGVGVLSGTVMERMFPGSLGTVFQIVAGIFAVATVFTYFALREPPHSSHQKRSLGDMFATLTGDVAAIIPVWFSLTIIVGFYFLLPAIVKNLAAESSLERSAGLILLGLIGLGAGALFFGRLSDVIGRTKTMMIGVVGELGFLLLFPELLQRLVIAPQGQSFVSSLVSLGLLGVVAGSFFFLGSALVPSILAYIGDRAAHDLRGSSMGLYSLMLSAGIALGNVLAGIAFQEGGVQAVFYLGAAILSGMSLTSGLLIRRNHIGSTPSPLTGTQSKPL